jgi:hypothetical protein
MAAPRSTHLCDFTVRAYTPEAGVTQPRRHAEESKPRECRRAPQPTRAVLVRFILPPGGLDAAAGGKASALAGT